ncbi:MAG: CHAT domain-containing tetratricopeptide repeat protein [Bacteroidota bacterium]
MWVIIEMMNGLKQIGIKTLVYFTCLLVEYFSIGQSCIQNLDSAIHFKYTNQQKAKFYANALLVALDSGRCPEGIGIAVTYNNLGLLLWEINEKSRGLYALKKGISQELQTKDLTHKDLIGPYYNLATLYQETSEFKEAEKYLNLAEKVIDDNYARDKKARITLLSKKGSYYREIGDFNRSLDFLNQALTINGIGNTDSTTIALLIEIGTTYKHFGDLKQSESELLKAIELAKDTNELQYLIAIDRLSTLKIEQGEYSDSENYLLYNLKRKEEKYSNDPVLALETLNGLSILYQRLNDLEASSDYINRALNITKNVRGVRPFLINNLGTIYMKKGDLDKALDCFKESTQHFEELYGKINPDYASGLSNLATVYKQQGKLSEALNLYTHVLDLDEVIYGEEHQRYATSLNNIALIYLELGNTSLAGRLLQQSREIRKKKLGQHHPLYIKNLNDLGIYFMLEKDTVKAMDHFNEALHLEIKHMQDIFPVLTDKQRQLYFNNVRYNIERFNSLAFSDGYVHSNYAEEAFNHFINTKGILFYAAKKMRRLIQNSNDKQVKSLYDLWKDEKYQLAQAYLLTTEERDFRKISIEELENKCNNLEKSLAQKISVFSEVNQTYYHTWQEVSSILDEKTATVDIISYRNYTVDLTGTTFNQGFENKYNYIALVIKSDSILYPIKLSSSYDLEKEFLRYRNALKYAVDDNKSYSLFWKPIDKVISNCTNIKFAPDGIYHKMNPSVYFDSTRNKYVADLYNIINITSAKDLLYHYEKDLNMEAKIFGNPDFSSLGLEFTLDQLPGAEREASVITEILDARSWQTSTYYFKDATEKSVKSLTNPGILHLATHGYFDDDPNHTNPLSGSGIFLSKEASGNEDGKLTAYEAMNLSLEETNAVVLTACETGLGTVQNGEGVFGLQRALLVAGSQNVILSLMKINDQAAMNFMRLFYQCLLDVKDPKNAFFKARRIFKEKDTNPYNWGAYILVSKG